MKNILEHPVNKSPRPSNIPPATDIEILAYLRRSCRVAEIAAQAEQQALIQFYCEQFGITVSEQELQSAGDAFRLEHRLLSAAETINWLTQQRIQPEDWSEGIRLNLLRQKLKEYLFGEVVDTHYMNNREHYQRVALSQILVGDLSDAMKWLQHLRQGQMSFCALALEQSKGKQSRENGGFVGVRFVAELIPEIAEAIAGAEVGKLIGPISTKFGYHIIRVEKWFPAELTVDVREYILETLFQLWLQNPNYAASQNRQDGL
jgi:Parvulin-like peptidyl-prolyl isomerase